MEGTPAEATTILPARQGIAVPLRAGQRLRIGNTHGGQVVDTWALAKADASECLSMEHTRTSLGKLMPAAGDHLYSSRRGGDRDTSARKRRGRAREGTTR